uniref:Uncharacterized protein n=1 Tax=Arundo donax TaxID=35708 RepID=A0A0A9AWS4_ARUDO
MTAKGTLAILPQNLEAN